MENTIKLLSMTRSKKSAERFYAEFDNGEGFTVTVTIIADYGLYSGKSLSGDEFAEIKKAAGISAAKSRALRILGTRPMSRGEITERLIQKGESAEAADAAADWLVSVGAVNDLEYAFSIVSHYAQKGYGLGKVREELYRRKIPREMWDEALEKMPDTQEKIDSILAVKLRGNKPDRKEIKKVSDMLLRRGFSYDEIRSALWRYSEDIEG